MSSKPSRQSPPQSAPLTMTKAEAYRLHQVLGQLKGFVSDPRHIHALVLLRRNLQTGVDAIDALNRPSERIREFEAKRIALCRGLSSKDTDGKPRETADGNYVIDPSKQIEFEMHINSLQSEYGSDIESHRNNIDRVNTLGLEPSGIGQLPKVPLSALRGSISLDQMEALFPIVIDDTGSTDRE